MSEAAEQPYVSTDVLWERSRIAWKGRIKSFRGVSQDRSKVFEISSELYNQVQTVGTTFDPPAPLPRTLLSLLLSYPLVIVATLIEVWEDDDE
jgi:hypothetical protein